MTDEPPKPPEEAAKPPEEAAKPPEEPAKPPEEATKPPEPSVSITPSRTLPRVQKLQKLHDSGRNVAQPAPSNGPALPPTTRAEPLRETTVIPAPLGSSGETPPGPPSSPPSSRPIPVTRNYDVGLTRRIELDPTLAGPNPYANIPPVEPTPAPLPTPRNVPPTRWRKTVERIPTWARPEPKKLRRRLTRALIVLVVLRLGVALALDFVIDVVCRELIGLECRVGHSTLRLASGEAVFEDLVLATPDGRPIATVGRAELDIRWRELPAIVIHRAVLEDARIALRREADGSMPALVELEELIAKPSKKKKGDSKPPRVVLEAVRVNHGRFEWEDLSTAPRLHEVIEIEARADDLALDGSRRDHPARASVRLSAPGLLDAFHLDAAARPDGEARIVDVVLGLEAHPRLLASYLAPHVRPEAHQVSVDLKAHLVTRPSLLEGEEGEHPVLTFEKVSLVADGEEIGFDRLVADAPRVTRDAIEVSTISLDRPRFALARRANGEVALAGFAFLPHDDPDGPAKPKKPSTFELPDFTVDEVAIHGGRFRFQDETTRPAVDLVTHDIEASLRGLVHDPKRPEAAAKLDVSVACDRVVNALRVEGAVIPFGAPRAAAVEVTARGATLAGLEPWLARAGLESGLANGTLRAKVEATAQEKPNGRLALEAHVRDLVLEDGKERAGITEVSVTGADFDDDTGELLVKDVTIAAPRARIERDAKGGVGFVGLRTRATPPEPAPARPERPSRKPPFIRHVAIEKVSLAGGACSWHDESLGGAPVDLAVESGSLTVTGIAFDTSSTHGGPHEPARLKASARLGPGLGHLALEAALVPDPAAPAISGTIAFTHVAPSALAPYLSRASIEPLLHEGTLEARLEASARTDGLALTDGRVVVERLALRAPDRELAAVDRLELHGAAIHPIERTVDLGAIALSGVRARVARVASGSTDAFGLRFKERPPEPESPADAAAATERPAKVRWGELTLEKGAFVWEDASVEPAATLRVTRLDVSIGARHFDNEELRGAPPLEHPAPFRLHADLADAGSLDLAGGLVPSTRAPVFFADLHATGLTLRALEPYLAQAGLAPALVSGDLRARVEGSANLTRPSIRARLLVRDLGATDGGRELAGLDRASLVIDLDRVARELTLSGTTIERPRLGIHRAAGGEVTLLGLQLRAPVRAAPLDSPRVARGERSGVAVAFDGARIDELALHWTDEAAGARLDVIHGHLELGAARLGAKSESAPFSLSAEVAGVASLEATGGVRLDGAAPSVSATLAVTNLRGERLDPYLRDHGALLLREGSLEARVRVTKEPAPEGGSALLASVEGLVLCEGRHRLLAWETLRASIPRLDADALVIDELALGGLQGELERFADGRIRLAGFELRPGPPAPPRAVAPPAGPAPEMGDADLSPLPRIDVKGIGISVESFAIHDRVGAPDAPPFVVEDLHLTQPWPFSLTHENRASAFLALVGSVRVKDVVERAQVQVQLLPFDSEPHASFDLRLEGVSGPALVERAPELAPRIDASAVQKGSLHAYFSLDLKNRRRLDAILSDLRAQPLSFDASLTDLEARATPDGPVVLGLDELHVDATTWNVATGEVRLRVVELANPVLRLRKETAGWRFLDVLWKNGPPGAEPAEAPREAPDAPPGPEFRIDRIAITDGDLLLEDGSITPESSLPLSALEIELTGFSTRMLRERRPARVSIAARSTSFFDELSAHGSVVFAPQFDADLDALLTGVRVQRISGYTQRAWRLGLKEGRLDLDARGRVRNGRLGSNMRFTLTDVQVDEPPEGSVIGQKAGLSVKSALGLLKDDDDVVVVDVPLGQQFVGLRATGEWDVSGVIASALKAAVKGIASKPLAAMESVGKSIKGAVAGRDDDERKIVKVPFEPADAQLPQATLAELEAVAGRLKADSKLRASLRAEVGTQDEERARKLSAPRPEERRDLIARLEARRARLESRRTDAESEVRAALLSGSEEEIGPARARHARAARAVQEADRSLDRLYDQERDARGRSGERRTHDVAASLSEARVEAVRAYLVQQGVSVEQIKALRPRLKPGEDSAAAGRVLCEVQVAPAK